MPCPAPATALRAQENAPDCEAIAATGAGMGLPEPNQPRTDAGA